MEVPTILRIFVRSLGKVSLTGFFGSISQTGCKGEGLGSTNDQVIILKLCKLLKMVVDDLLLFLDEFRLKPTLTAFGYFF